MTPLRLFAVHHDGRYINCTRGDGLYAYRSASRFTEEMERAA